MAASKLHKHRGTCYTAEWPYCLFAILCRGYIKVYDVKGNNRFPLFVLNILKPGDSVGIVTPLVYMGMRSDFVVDIIHDGFTEFAYPAFCGVGEAASSRKSRHANPARGDVAYASKRNY